MMISKYTHPAIKQAFLVLLLGTQFCFAQTKGIPDTIKSAFEGTWQYKEKYFTNTIKIHFEPGKPYALFTDIGTDVAPTKTFKVQLKGNLLVLPAVRNQNDYIEMEIIKGRLYFKSLPVQWDEKGNIISSNKDHREQRIFRRVKK
jgi:hypothetical protein